MAGHAKRAIFVDGYVAEVVQKYDGLTRADEYVADDEFWEEVSQCGSTTLFNVASS